MSSPQQKEDNLFEIKVPIFCEWTLDEHLSADSNIVPSFYNYVVDMAENSRTINLTTTEYALPGFPLIKYYLSICMDGDELLEFYFYAIINYSTFNIEYEFTSTITNCESKHFVGKFEGIHEDRESFGLLKCLPEECNGCPLCGNKKIVVRVKGIFTVKQVDGFYFFPMEVSDVISELTNDTKDFVIVAEEREIRVHKSVLAEHSTVFARMLDCENWKEIMENRIVIPDFSYKIVKYAINACCDKLFDKVMKKNEYLKLYQFADKYDMEKLAEAVKKHIAFTPHNVVEYANSFFKNHVIELVNCCIDYIFSCSQYSIPIEDIEMLNSQIRGMFFDRVLISPVLKKDPKAEHRNFNFENDINQN